MFAKALRPPTSCYLAVLLVLPAACTARQPAHSASTSRNGQQTDGLELELADARRDLEDAKESAHALTQQLDTAQVETARLRNELNAARDKADRLEGSLAQEKSALAQARAEIELLRIQVEHLKQQNQGGPNLPAPGIPVPEPRR